MSASAAPFSYAQAARGQVSALTSTTPASDQPVGPAADGTPASDESTESATLSTAEVRGDGPQATSETKPDSASATKASSVTDSSTTHNDTPASSGASSVESRRDEDTNSELSAQRSVKGMKSHASTQRSTNSRPTSSGPDTKRTRRERKPKGAGAGSEKTEKAFDGAEEPAKEVPPPPKVELCEAPIPTVNPWHQRLDAQMAKTKPISAPVPAKPSAASPLEAPQPAAQKPSTSSAAATSRQTSDAVSVNGAAPQKKIEGDGPRKSSSQHKSDSRRPANSLLGDDSSSWPTPDTAIKEEKRKSTDKITEPVEKPPVDDQSTQKGKQSGKKDWVKIPFVPSVNFQTQLPPKGTRTRGGARGGRENSTRGGGHVSSSAKDPEKTSAPSNPAKVVNGEGREGSRESPASTRGSSVPPMPNKRGSLGEGPAPREQRKHSVPGLNKAKDGSGNEQARDKHENRGERTRGGPRSRGGYHGSMSQVGASHASFTPGYAQALPPRQQNVYSPPIRQGHFSGNSFGTGPSRGGRGGRNGSGSRASGSNNTNGRHQPAPFMGYDSFHHAPVMGYPQAPAQQYYFDPVLVNTLSAQLSWYFSIENLCRDMYLRKQMDSQGYVFASLILGFNRVQTLLSTCPDQSMCLRQACQGSKDVELVIGMDGIERLRVAHDPTHWVLPMSERSDEAANPGPETVFPVPAPQYPMHPNMSHPGYTQPAMNQYPSFAEGQAEPYMNGTGHDYVNGYVANYSNGVRETVLKPTVPEFSPRTAGEGSFSEQMNGGQVPKDQGVAVVGNSEVAASKVDSANQVSSVEAQEQSRAGDVILS